MLQTLNKMLPDQLPSGSSTVEAVSETLIEQVRSVIIEKIQNYYFSAEDNAPESVRETIVRMLEYNTRGGKQIRLRTTVAAFKHFAPNASEDDLFLANVLGWIIEIFQGAACMIDDVVDTATVRRGNPCWHQLPEVGSVFIVDTHLMVNICDFLLEHFFGEKTYFLELHRVYNCVKRISLLGERMDSNLTAGLPLEEFTESLYQTICYGRTSCYTFYFPVAAALTMVPTCSLDKKLLEAVATELGYFYSVQDDFLDVFGDPKKTGKMSSDIQERKCTWIIAYAWRNADQYQRKLLENHYGHVDECGVLKVKEVFRQVGIPNVYGSKIDEIKAKFAETLEKLPREAPKELYQRLFRELEPRTH